MASPRRGRPAVGAHLDGTGLLLDLIWDLPAAASDACMLMASDSFSVLKLPPAGGERGGLQLVQSRKNDVLCALVPLSARKLYPLSPLLSSQKPPWTNRLQVCCHCLPSAPGP